MNRVVLLFILILFAVLSCKKEQDEESNNTHDNNSHVGTSSNAFLASDVYEEMILEVLYMEGVKPTEESVSNLESFLLNYLNKPSGISLVLKEIETDQKSTYEVSDLIDLEEVYREHYNEENKISASLLIVDGEYAPNSQVLGVAYKNTSMAVFGKPVSENSGGISQPSKTKLETTIMNHEMGHLLGLVNVGTPMVEDHQDEENGNHCNNEDCLMYYTVETTEITSFLVGSDIPELDQKCKNDLIANGGK